jgi:hypothetical protein
VRDLQGLLARGLDVRVGADARGLSAIIVVSGTSRDKCLKDLGGIPGGAEPLSKRLRASDRSRPRGVPIATTYR